MEGILYQTYDADMDCAAGTFRIFAIVLGLLFGVTGLFWFGGFLIGVNTIATFRERWPLSSLLMLAAGLIGVGLLYARDDNLQRVSVKDGWLTLRYCRNLSAWTDTFPLSDVVRMSHEFYRSGGGGRYENDRLVIHTRDGQAKAVPLTLDPARSDPAALGTFLPAYVRSAWRTSLEGRGSKLPSEYDVR